MSTKFDTLKLKAHLAKMQTDGRINDMIDELYNKWDSDRNNVLLCVLLLEACFWAIDDYLVISKNPGHSREWEISQGIEWNFNDKMFEAVNYGLEAFKDNFTFQLRIGYLFAMGDYWFVNDSLPEDKAFSKADEMCKKSLELNPESELAKAFSRLLTGAPSGSAEVKARVFNALQQFAPGDNCGDLHLRFIFETL